MQPKAWPCRLLLAVPVSLTLYSWLKINKYKNQLMV